MWKDALVDEFTNIEHSYTHKQTMEALYRAIAALSPRLRHVVETYQLQDCSVVEIAERSQITVAAAKSRMLRARTALRASYRLRRAL
jgi:RNA polymerase sigma-70 factor (ECF subfamily)